MSLSFGTKSKDYTPVTIDPDDVWIKGLQTGDTKIRFLEPTDEWITYREHYDPAVRRSFPCTEDTNTCPGCTSDSERTKGRSRKYAFNALNDRGMLNVYKVGSKFRNRLQQREQRIGTLLDRDYVLIRTGTNKDNTEYDYEGMERSDCDFDGELYDIPKALSGQYMQYLEMLAGADQEPAGAEEVHEEEVKPKPRGQVSKTAEEIDAEYAAAQREKAAEETKATETADLTPEQFDEELEDWTLSKMKDYLNEKGVEFPARAGRPVLGPLCKKAYFGF